MKIETIHDNLLNAIRSKMPQNANIASFLMEVLCIGKEAVYRRLRSEVPFTMEEATTICKTLGISFDALTNIDIPQNRPFQLRLTEFINPDEVDYVMMERFNEILYESRVDENREVGISANILPQIVFLNYDYLTKFYLFKWLYQWNGATHIKSLDDVKISPRLDSIHKRYVEESMYISYTYYIWDNLIFHYLVNEIKYFASIRFISTEDVLALKEDLLKLVEDMEVLAMKGAFETGAKLQFYLSSINLESTYSYLQMQNYNISHIKVFTLGSVYSFDPGTFERMKNRIQSLKRLSTLISESGEMQRVQFFKKQRELINSMG
ncbi:hypothetical protein [Prevotella sp. 10(H)]|uniref:hypothetical protein n=1 Tax=Prevotella sp. 10(H) TaxID=1158294 RepID=UPI0004A76246|nr:hypothetical protein [Prevotella sp. 10(H)]